MWETCIKPKAEVYEPMTKLVGYKEEEGTQGQNKELKKRWWYWRPCDIMVIDVSHKRFIKIFKGY